MLAPDGDLRLDEEIPDGPVRLESLSVAEDGRGEPGLDDRLERLGGRARVREAERDPTSARGYERSRGQQPADHPAWPESSEGAGEGGGSGEAGPRSESEPASRDDDRRCTGSDSSPLEPVDVAAGGQDVLCFLGRLEHVGAVAARQPHLGRQILHRALPLVPRDGDLEWSDDVLGGQHRHHHDRVLFREVPARGWLGSDGLSVCDVEVQLRDAGGQGAAVGLIRSLHLVDGCCLHEAQGPDEAVAIGAFELVCRQVAVSEGEESEPLTGVQRHIHTALHAGHLAR